MKNKHNGCIRGYYRAHKAWYADANDIKLPEIVFGMYHPDGSTTGEMQMKWVMLQNSLCAKLISFEDSWSLLSLFSDLIKKMGKVDSQNIQEEEFVKILDECGFKDLTAYIQK